MCLSVLPEHMSMFPMCVVSERGIDSPGNGVVDGYKPPCGTVMAEGYGRTVEGASTPDT
jgi:hypothetical protein